MLQGLFYDNVEYSIEGFLRETFNEPFLNSSQKFIESWYFNKPFIFRSSGSTGTPREFVFEKWQLEISAKATINALGLEAEREHFLICINTSFVGGAMMLARAFLLNCKVTFMKPTSDVFTNISNLHTFTFGSFVPVQLQDISFSLEKYNRFKSVLIGGSKLEAFRLQQLALSDVNSYQTYGMTETLSHVALKRLNADIGYRALEPYKIRIDNNQQICIQVPFLKEELISNDIGIWVEPNQFEWRGRVDFVINSGGIKIIPEEIEDLIREMEVLSEGCRPIISSIPHPKWGNELVLITNKAISIDCFNSIVNSLANDGLKIKAPKRFFIINEIPLTENGKLDRKKINEWLENQQVSY